MEDIRPRKAAHSLQKEVGQNIKDKNETKELGMETCPGEGVVKEKKFPHSRKPSHRWVCREFWNLTGRGKKPTEDMPNCNFHKTTSECWKRTPGTQKGTPFSSKGGRTKYKRQKERQKS